MTARPLRVPRSGAGLRVIQGKRVERPVVGPWMAFSVVVVVAILGMVVARTTLDRGAFQLAELNRGIAEAETVNQQRILEVSRLESPARIGPMAEEMGLVYPTDREPLLIQGVVGPQPGIDPRWAGIEHFAAPRVEVGGVAYYPRSVDEDPGLTAAGEASSDLAAGETP